jgi:hypothetical protein
MHLKSILSASTILTRSATGVALGLLCGCSTMSLTNLTPSSLPENPSEIYTFTLRVIPKNDTVVRESISPHIIVDGQTHDMKPSAIAPMIYDFDYQLPPARTEIAYYYLVDYKVQGNDLIQSVQAYTDVTHAAIVRRYVLALEVNRGPVGARIGVLGRGFTPQDAVAFDGTAVRTVYESPTSLGFFVPALSPGRNYQVTLSSPAGNSPIGTFRIDSSTVTVEPAALTLTPGQSQTLSFTLPNPAPAGGLLLDVTTDVPESVIMPEVVVPAGQATATVTVQGGKPGSGSLFLKGYAGGELTIPLTVSAGLGVSPGAAPMGTPSAAPVAK